MLILQIVLPGASEYDRKCQRVDHSALAAMHQVIVATAEDPRRVEADVTHVYTSDPSDLQDLDIGARPFVSTVDLPRSRWPLRRRRPPPRAVVSPLPDVEKGDRHRLIPEAVEETFWHFREPSRSTAESEVKVIGSLARPAVGNVVDQTFSRIERYRSDVVWKRFTHPPAPSEVASVDVWVDPAIGERDFDGFVAEALVTGRPVVAARTPINSVRLEKGRTGFLVPPGDPNEMTHAILAALFKPEVVDGRLDAARQTIAKFSSSKRLRALLHAYQTLIP